MPYPADYRRLTREKILKSARRLFNRHGFEAVSIDDVSSCRRPLGTSFWSMRHTTLVDAV